MSKRADIRVKARALLAQVYAQDIEISRNIDARDKTEFISLYLASGQQTSDGMTTEHTAQLIIGINKQNASDDQLDTIGDLLETAMESSPTLNGAVYGFEYEGFEYGSDDSSGFQQLFLKYNIFY